MPAHESACGIGIQPSNGTGRRADQLLFEVLLIASMGQNKRYPDNGVHDRP
jgi:hypothetical protein